MWNVEKQFILKELSAKTVKTNKRHKYYQRIWFSSGRILFYRSRETEQHISSFLTRSKTSAKLPAISNDFETMMDTHSSENRILIKKGQMLKSPKFLHSVSVILCKRNIGVTMVNICNI